MQVATCRCSWMLAIIHGAFKYFSFDARNSSQSTVLLPSKTKKLNSENEREIDLYSLHY